MRQARRITAIWRKNEAERALTQRKRHGPRNPVKQQILCNRAIATGCITGYLPHVATAIQRPNGDEARLWAAALCVSVLLNGLLLAWISIAVIRAEMERRNAVPKALEPEQTVQIFPEMFNRETAPTAPPEIKTPPPEVVRTSPEQESAEPPASRRYIGERNTTATSDRAPDPNAPAMPSQAGREPRSENEIETTQSTYQDGRLDAAAATQPISPPAAELAEGVKSPDPGEAEKAETAIREKLLDGPNPVETQVAKAEVREDIKPREETKARDGAADALAEKKVEEMPKPKPAPIDDPAFRGNQSKTAIRGSISRTGESSLDVADSPLGRYQAAINRAVEKEWQLNCVRHRDFITPGFLTIRFYVTAEGRVKSVQFVGDNQTGEVQKGFTLNSIRNAPIPPMPPAVKKEMGGDALELTFSFYF